MYDLARGPFIWVAFVIFIIGMVYRIIQINALIRVNENYKPSKVQQKKPAKKKAAKKPIAPKISADEIALQRILKFKDSLLYKHPVVAIVSFIFHCCLLIAPLFALGHSLAFYQSWGFATPSLPDGLIDFLTILVLVGGLFFLIRRLMIPRVRAISSINDYLLLLVTAAPFLTGFMAYHQWFDYKTIILLHLLAGEIMLITIPFTKLGHMVFFFFVRFFTRSEHNWGSGKKGWIV
jgi:nitrate reductase gamma subunit